MSTVTGNQPTLFNVKTKTINPSWVDPNQPLLVPENPLHFHAHRLQLLLQRLDNQAENNPAQFNAANYNTVLEKFTRLCEAINEGLVTIDEVLGQGKLAKSGDSGAAPKMGDTASTSGDFGVSADNPLAG